MLPGRPRVLRDPIHGDIAFPRNKFGELLEAIFDTQAYQRLRGIRQNGVMNLVFHGAEHSRFAHSIGVAHIAGAMFDASVSNSQVKYSENEREETILAALLHDVGHGPFSHTLEEIIKATERSQFDHETMTERFISEPGSEIYRILSQYRPDLPSRLVPYINKKKRTQSQWFYAIVSSQLDADRIDYLMRDSRMSGVNHLFDSKRLIQFLGVFNGEMVLDRRASDVVESFLLAIDQMYSSAYFHKTVRAASVLLSNVIRRAVDLAASDKAMQDSLFPVLSGSNNQLWAVFEKGDQAPLSLYDNLDEHLVWTLILRWRGVSDRTLSDLTQRLLTRNFFKAITLDKLPTTKRMKAHSLAQELVKRKIPDVDPKYYLDIDEPERVSYKRFTLGEGPSASIKLLDDDNKVRPVEELPRSIARIIAEKMYFPRLIVPEEVRDEVEAWVRKESK
jgi:hypothetical protein